MTKTTRNTAEIGELLGFGIHGIVLVLKSEQEVAATALKVHYSAEPFKRERDTYERLNNARITQIVGFHVPQLLRHHHHLADGAQSGQ